MSRSEMHVLKMNTAHKINSNHFSMESVQMFYFGYLWCQDDDKGFRSPI